MRVGIVGLGLVGGSIALAIHEKGEWHAFGVDRDRETREAALAARAVDAAYSDVADAPVEQADLLLLCLHPEAAEQTLLAIAPRLTPGTVVSDVCGIKRGITLVARRVLPEGVCFIGGHPMAGREQNGFAYAVSDLFVGAHYLLTPPDDAPPEATAMLCDLAEQLGCADVRLTDPDTHDASVAYTSHMMHVLALSICEQRQLMTSKGFEGNSFEGTTRVAAMDVDLWNGIFWNNRDVLAASIAELEGKLAGYRALLEGDDREVLRARMREAVARKEEWNRA